MNNNCNNCEFAIKCDYMCGMKWVFGICIITWLILCKIIELSIIPFGPWKLAKFSHGVNFASPLKN